MTLRQAQHHHMTGIFGTLIILWDHCTCGPLTKNGSLWLMTIVQNGIVLRVVITVLTILLFLSSPRPQFQNVLNFVLYQLLAGLKNTCHYIHTPIDNFGDRRAY